MKLRFLLIVLVMFTVDLVWAQGEGKGVPWNQLSVEEQTVLQRFGDKWDQLSPRRQERLLKGARKWSAMSPEQRQEAQHRFRQWQTMPDEQREQLRERFQRFRDLPPEEREAVRQARRWFKSLPEERRKELKEQFKGMSPQEKRAYREQLRRQWMEQHPVAPPGSIAPSGGALGGASNQPLILLCSRRRRL
jgi:hypothetical protein